VSRAGRFAGLALSLAAAASVATAASAQVVLGDRPDGARVRASSGAVLEVRLTSNPSTGYTWRMIGAPPGLRLVSERYDAPPPARRPILLVGRPGVQSFRVRVIAPPGRRSLLRFAYRRWWTKVALARVWTVTVTTPPVRR
jgi:predicted secreted protein